ncbi:hypothetical protein CJ030_MR2G024103 [Morella rubra]|uniref:Uncharacterized protein n=1 Tax=Morella rubra TaxID=262757 RepID=A0A6A1WGU2_9ROSI|nr:hypothetical protein CJ030_MR2G024105 [Morella rubra]KAB1223606.1 hypothetical protein CJ030_MR2G024103 [Morella rubra]
MAVPIYRRTAGTGYSAQWRNWNIPNCWDHWNITTCWNHYKEKARDESAQPRRSPRKKSSAQTNKEVEQPNVVTVESFQPFTLPCRSSRKKSSTQTNREVEQPNVVITESSQPCTLPRRSPRKKANTNPISEPLNDNHHVEDIIFYTVM